MIVASHQPHFNPYLGYFAKMRLADVFILSDDVKFIKNGFIHRNRIRSWQAPEGWRWLTVPVRYRSDSAVSQVEMAQGWDAAKLLNIIEFEYRNAPYYPAVFKCLETVWKNIDSLPDFALFSTLSLATFSYLIGGITPCRRQASTIQCRYEPGDKNGRLIALTKAVGGTAYLAGSEAARVYLDPVRFREAGITLLGLEYLNPQYPQRHGGFLPKMGVIDALMNVGQGVRPLIGEEFCRIVELT
jgi:hypothetical protein